MSYLIEYSGPKIHQMQDSRFEIHHIQRLNSHFNYDDAMAAIGSLVFCTDCGNLLPSTKGSERNTLSCECCGAENKGLQTLGQASQVDTLLIDHHTDTGSKTIVTNTKPSDFPSFLRQKLQSSVQNVERHNIQTESAADETCKKCGSREVTYTTVQLRSADEGSTVIYNCVCGNSYVTSLRVPAHRRA